ncbi:G protein-activated inward rectifier potassium channel 3 isoform X2 [Sinocyclocheilus rhinocerous]|nr:PREDICTED: G protein-activated inward rectifier potassium channel 3-like isoform X1 [Sinocyclocheilus rhinocerous]XP_016407815.1 PREDICTED: G protein-activated inward rectifier potassium channel 3-like isoform X1 [Sinocyclocheilus rhinocerous]XP_016407816.1 PREDICTED: G protein-activated inward rectifier potassium channel 3-like isoform X1 [Sinocyclocheilus rhinocerous]XP_016407818.1 PREDICTED: G protein-activated inward rectifier potassium channel 3-like isoform X2 [Sinocyclocheilus rhinocer
MLSGVRSAPVEEGRGTSGPTQDDARTRPATINNLNPKSSCVVLCKPGDGVRHQLYIPTILPQSDNRPDSTGGNSLPLPDIMPNQASKPSVSIRRHKSTTDLPYSPQRGYMRGQRPSICAPTEAELALMRRCSLREPNIRPCCRHALSVPNMASPNTSPLCSTPSRSALCTPVRDIECSPKARNKLIESENVQTPTCPPEHREQCRYISKDGKCRVDLAHMAERERFLADIFTSFVDLQYRWFLFVFMMCYAVTWFIFAGLYSLNAFLRGDLEVPGDADVCYPNIDGFVSALLFSVETQKTIGYGAHTVSPRCYEGVLLVMAQCIVGSMIDALMVGCMLVKISRPKKRAETLLFSRTCVVAYRDDRLCLVFRLGDLRESHMVDAKVRAKLIKSRQTSEGEFLPLEQSEIDLGYESGSDRLFLVEPQVIQHTIDSSSPFWELGPEQLRKQQFEIIVILEGIVEATGMMCQAKTSYIETEIEWGARFEPCMTLEKGAFRVDLRRFHSTYPVPLPPCSAQEQHHLQTLQVGLELQESLKDSANWKLGGDDQEDDIVKPPGACPFTIHNIQEERVSEVNECESL